MMRHGVTSRIRSVLGYIGFRFRDAAAKAILLCLVFTLAACSEKVVLQTGLKDADANEIVSILSRNGIEARKASTKEGVNLSVKEADISRATDVMRAAGLPRQALSSLGQIFKKEGMISTPLEERARYIWGLSQELAHTLQEFDRVVSARVHVVLPERVAPGEPIQPSSAAVFIKYQPPFDEDSSLPRIRQMVASSIPGLSGEEGLAKVSIVMTPAEDSGPNIEWTKIGPFSVQVGSVNSLVFTLLGLSLMCVLSFSWAISITLMRSAKAKSWFKNAAKKVPAIKVPKKKDKSPPGAGTTDPA